MKKVIMLFTVVLLVTGSLFAQQDMAVLMCIGDGDALGEGEIIMRDHLEGLGMVVDAVTAGNTQSSDAANYDMIFVHEHISSSAVGDKFKNEPTPVMSTEFYISDDMAFSGSTGDTDFGQIGADPGSDFLFVEEVEHPITEGFSGEVVVYDGPGNMGFAVIGGDGVSLLSNPDNPDQSMLYTFEEGSADINGDEVPARRVFFFTFDLFESIMTDDAWTLFDRSVKWVLGIEDTRVDYRPNRPESFHLAQNHPNPFNPVTTIQYDISNTVHVKLDVFNARGEKVAMLVNEQQAAGSYTHTFDASELSSGIYLYRLQAGDQIVTKKMVLAR